MPTVARCLDARGTILIRERNTQVSTHTNAKNLWPEREVGQGYLGDRGSRRGEETEAGGRNKQKERTVDERERERGKERERVRARERGKKRVKEREKERPF